MQILQPFKEFMPLRTRSVLLAFKNAFKCNKAFPQRFAGDLQAFMANALFCQLNMTGPHLANGNGDSERKLERESLESTPTPTESRCTCMLQTIPLPLSIFADHSY